MMAEALETNDEHPEQLSTAGETSPGSGKGLLIAFVGIVVLLETAMFFFLVPSAEQVSAIAEQKLIQSIQQGETKADEQASDENKVEEFDLGRYGETFSPIGSQKTFLVEIVLYGLVRSKNQEAMKTEFSEKEGRLSHTIRMAIRNSALEELNENNLGLLERRILTKCNHLLEDDLLLGVGFKGYRLVEQ
jgi:flagellar basal body-associated protein FliL